MEQSKDISFPAIWPPTKQHRPELQSDPQKNLGNKKSGPDF